MNFTIKYMKPLGEFDSKFGQKYWGKVEESEMDASFNLLHPVNFDEGDQIEFSEKAIKETKAGKEYMQLKKVRKTSGTQENNAPQPFKAAEKPAADKFLRDASTIPMDVYRVVANIRGLPESKQDEVKFWEIVNDHSTNLLTLIDSVRSGSGEASKPSLEQASPSPTIKEPEDTLPQAAAGLGKARQTADRIKAKQLNADEANDLLAGLGEEEYGA